MCWVGLGGFKWVGCSAAVAARQNAPLVPHKCTEGLGSNIEPVLCLLQVPILIDGDTKLVESGVIVGAWTHEAQGARRAGWDALAQQVPCRSSQADRLALAYLLVALLVCCRPARPFSYAPT